MTLLITVILGILSAYMYEFLAKKVAKKRVISVRGYRLHHSLYGIYFILVWLFTQQFMFLGLGIGIIIQHTYTDGFKFVSKS